MTDLSVSDVSQPEHEFDCIEEISGYSLHKLRDFVFSRLNQFTGTHIREKIENFKADLADAERRASRIFISVGENCGPALRLQEANAPLIGGGYFDFLVLKPGALEHIIRDDFAHALMLKNLCVSRWEGCDSIYDAYYGIWYHHLFHLPDEKKRNSSRRIDETDIPLLLVIAKAQFEYLHEKMRLTLRSPLPKTLVYRAVDGRPLSPRRLDELSLALEQYGARNCDLTVVYSRDEADLSVADRHVFIAESEDARWGCLEDWRGFVDANGD